jgi:hypothetical protein
MFVQCQVSEHSSWSIGFYSRIVEAALAAAGAPAIVAKSSAPPILSPADLSALSGVPPYEPFMGSGWDPTSAQVEHVVFCSACAGVGALLLGASASTAASLRHHHFITHMPPLF